MNNEWVLMYNVDNSDVLIALTDKCRIVQKNSIATQLTSLRRGPFCLLHTAVYESVCDNIYEVLVQRITQSVRIPLINKTFRRPSLENS
jgi:hypothetical protein